MSAVHVAALWCLELGLAGCGGAGFLIVVVRMRRWMRGCLGMEENTSGAMSDYGFGFWEGIWKIQGLGNAMESPWGEGWVGGGRSKPCERRTKGEEAVLD
jgi:hypothetical protein